MSETFVILEFSLNKILLNISILGTEAPHNLLPRWLNSLYQVELFREESKSFKKSH